MWQMSFWQAALAKTGLCATCAGAVLNVATLSTPAATEVILNFGLALVCTWANWWHWTNHLHKQLEEYKKPHVSVKKEPAIKRAPSILRKRRGK
jgi:hypothetical protein